MVLCWAIAKLMLNLLGRKRPTLAVDKQGENLITSIKVEDDYPQLNVPDHPHLEVSVNNRLGYSNHLDHNNHFENEFCKGTYFVFHAPTVDGVDRWCADYFRGKKRLWEIRAHFKFKVPPSEMDQLFFAIELEQYVPMSAAVKTVQS